MLKDQQLLALYEISMSIGNSLELKKMLREAVTMILSRLNCSSAAIYQERVLLYARPKVLIRDAAYAEVVQGLRRHEHASEGQTIIKKSGDKYYYLFGLKNFGTLILTKSGDLLDDLIVNSMLKINLRLVNAIQACLDHKNVLESQTRLAQAQKMAHIGDWSIELTTASLYWSDELYRIAGRTRRTDMSWSVLKQWIHPDTVRQHEKYLEYLRRSRPGDSLLTLGSHMLRPDGESRWVEVTSAVEFDANERPVRFYGTAQDITERKHLEDELRASKDQFDLFMRHLPYIVAIKDESYKVVYTNPKAVEYLKRTSVGNTAFDNMDEAAAKEVYALSDRAKLEGKAEQVITIEAGGRPYIARVLAFAIPQYDGEVYVGMIYIDITEQYRDRHEIAKLQQVIEKSPVSIIITDKDGVIEYVNPWAQRLTGYSLDELVGENPRVLKSDLHPESEYIKLWDTISNSDVWSGMFRNIKKGGEEFWESAIIAPVVDDEGSILNYIAIKQEITEKVYLEQALEKQEELTHELGHIIEQSLNEIYIFDRESLKFRFVNLGARGNIDYGLEELLMLTPLDLDPKMSEERLTELLRPLEKDTFREIVYSAIHQRKDRSTYPVDVYVQSILFEGTEAYLAIAVDTSEREQMQKELHEKDEIMIAQSRHAAMGEMISMIAHQWRQPLTVIAMGANNMLADIELEELKVDDITRAARSILRQTDYLAKTINDFSDFFRPGKKREVVRIEDVMSEAEKIIGKSLENSGVSFSFESMDGCMANTYSRELLQVYVNLLENAKEALVINRVKARHVRVLIRKEQDHTVTTICDNGGGIDEEILEKVFDPYFSTKDSKNGTGLGLYMSKTIIEKHLNGTIKVANVDDGACMTIRLPIDASREKDRSG